MADVKVSSFATEAPPLDGNELVTGLVGSVNKNMTTQEIANLAGSNSATNGVAIEATNTLVIGQSYTIPASSINLGTSIQYQVDLQAININASPLTAAYRLKIFVGGVLYDFSLNQPQVSDTGDNTKLIMTAKFRVFEEPDTTTHIAGYYTLQGFNPGDGSFATYQYTEFYNQAFNVGVDDFQIESELSTFNVDVTLRAVASELNINY